jgi:hypothetical protein
MPKIRGRMPVGTVSSPTTRSDRGRRRRRSGITWGRQFRRVIAGRKPNDITDADPQDDTLPTVSSADEFRAVAAEAIPDLINRRLAEIAAQDIDPRSAMAASKLQIELGVGQIPTEEEIEGPEEEEIHRAIAALPPNLLSRTARTPGT